MRTVLLALGSRGDVQPFVVLAQALQSRGQECVVVALRDYADLVQRAGVDFEPIQASLEDAQNRPTAGLAGTIALHSSVVQILLMRRWLRRIAKPIADAIELAVRSGDTLLTGILTRDCATAGALHIGGRAATIVFTGVVPTSSGPSLFQAPQPTETSQLNRWVGLLGWQIATSVSLGPSRVLRRRWGLPRVTARGATAAGNAHPTIVAVDPLLIPVPEDQPAMVHQTGSIVAPLLEGWSPPTEVVAFLSAAPLPVYIGFGSPGAGYRPVSALTLDSVARRARCQIISPAPPGVEPGLATDRVLLINDLPHEWLIPRTAAMVHHGGAGTTAAGLRAGVPSSAVPFAVDQPYHARKLRDLGVGPAPLARSRLNSTRLAALITQLTTGPNAATYRERAAEVGRIIRAEDGRELTVATLQGLGLVDLGPDPPLDGSFLDETR